MSILSYVTVTSSLVPQPLTPTTSLQPTKPTKILFRNNESSQVSEGALSGPPTTSKKYRGGEEMDPLESLGFGAGFLGSLIYICMLGSNVDSLADGAKGLNKGEIGQPRLLVPVVLVMIYNRWNGIWSLHLELIPMLIGFFTYRVATFTQAIEDALSGFSRKTQP